jgi:hypothetical protein
LNCATLASLAWTSYVGFAMFFPPFALRICFFAIYVRRRQESSIICTLLWQCAHKASLRRDQVMPQMLIRPIVMI